MKKKKSPKSKIKKLKLDKMAISELDAKKIYGGISTACALTRTRGGGGGGG